MSESEKLFEDFKCEMLKIRKSFQNARAILEEMKNNYCFKVGQICKMEKFEDSLHFDQEPDEKGVIVKTIDGVRKSGLVIIVNVETDDGESWLAESEDEECLPNIYYTVLRISLNDNNLFDHWKLTCSKTWATYSDVLIEGVKHKHLELYKGE